jgi:hypothetical protein
MTSLLSWRSLGAIVGAALLGAVAHVNITSTGGYSEPHALVVLAVAAGVGCGSVFAGMAWAAGAQAARRAVRRVPRLRRVLRPGADCEPRAIAAE